MVVGTSRLSYKRLRLSLPIIAASLFHENNITTLTKLEINSLQAQGDLDFELVKMNSNLVILNLILLIHLKIHL